MKAVMEQVNKLFDAVVKKDEDLNKDIVKNNTREKELQAIAEKQKEKNIELGERQVKISGVESMVKLQEQIDAKLKQNGEENDKLDKARAAFESYKAGELKYIEDVKRDIDSIKKALLISAEKQRETIKAEILKELSKNTP